MTNLILTYLCAFSFILVKAQTTFTNSSGPLSMNEGKGTQVG
jgi:hypothetical protein